MRILVDGDACPVKNEIKEIALKYGVNVIYYTSISHYSFDKIFENTIYTDNFFQGVDTRIINDINEEDILVTDDYGLACAVIDKCYCVISSTGNFYTDNNIEVLLYQRYLNEKARKKKIKVSNKKKRKDKDNESFYNSLKSIVTN